MKRLRRKNACAFTAEISHLDDPLVQDKLFRI